MKKTGEKRKHRESLFLRWVLWALLFVVIFAIIVGFAFAIYMNRNIEKSIDESLFSMVGSDSATTLYYYGDNGEGDERVALEYGSGPLYGGYRCSYVRYDQIPEKLVRAFISIEDKRFYEHRGVDWKRTISAGFNYFLNFDDSYGGSTITQQLIKNVTEENDYSFQRKIQEIFWALDLETKMDKNEILELYLNIINLSQGCYGVQAAANYYFSKDVSELSLGECACIAAITNSPSFYDPIRNPENNRRRSRLILHEMYEQEYIGYEEYQKALNEEVTVSVNTRSQGQKIQSWYADMVIEDVVNDLVEEKGYGREMANLMIYTGGLKIYTAVDPEIQEILELYYAKSSHFYSGGGTENPQSSMIVIDPYTGDILGVAGAIGEKKANRIQNFATQTLRPAGSVIKPLSVYAPALKKGLITWSSVYDDVPVRFEKSTGASSGENADDAIPWPKNSTGEYRGLTNINYALEHSVNTVTVRVLEELGVDQSFRFLYEDLHMKHLISEQYIPGQGTVTDRDFASLALGQMNYGLTVEEVTAAYSIFVDRGIYHSPRSYYQVTDHAGNVILENEYRGEIVLSEEESVVMTRMLENVVLNGTARSITLKDTVSCAGKTGTTQNNYDRWYVGYTPDYIGGVWYGYEYPKALQGGNACVSIWDQVMTRIYQKKALQDGERHSFSESDKVIEAEYCMDSGKLMTPACERDPRGTRSEKGYFIKGSEPTEYCDRHVPVAYDQQYGGVVGPNECPKDCVEYVGLIFVERKFPIQIFVTDAQYVWRDIGTRIFPETSPKLPFFYNLLSEGEYCGISNTEQQYNRFCRSHFDYLAWKERQ